MALTPAQKNFTLVGVLLALFLGALGQTIVAAVLPGIVQGLRGLDRYPWATTAYLLATAIMAPIYGKLAGTLNRKSVELAAASLFLAGSFLCGLSGALPFLSFLGDGMTQLILFRVIQGLGGAGLFAMAFIVIADLFPPAERGRYQGLVGAVFGLASVLGPLAGGFLADYAGGLLPGVAGWRWMFFVNLPFGVLALWLIAVGMPPLRPAAGRAPPDSPGRALPAAGFLPLEPRLFRSRVYAASLPALFFVGAAFLSLVIFLPLFLVHVAGVSPTRAGLSLIPASAGLVFGAALTGQRASRFGHYKLQMLAGGALLAVGLFLLSRLRVDTGYWQVTFYMLLCGLGLGPTFPLYSLAVQNAVEPRHLGQATGTSLFFRQIGGAVGVAGMGTVLAGVLAATLVGLPAFDPGTPGEPGRALRVEADRQYALAERALRSGDLGALEELMADRRYPTETKKRLITGALAGGSGAEQALAGIRDLLTLRAERTAAAASRAVREAYTRAVTRIFFYAFFAVLAALAITLFIPEPPLRRGRS